MSLGSFLLGVLTCGVLELLAALVFFALLRRRGYVSFWNGKLLLWSGTPRSLPRGPVVFRG